MQIKIKFSEKRPLKLYRSTFLQNKINVFIVNTVKLNDFRPDQSTRFGRPQAITRISRLAGLAVKDLGIRLAFTRLAGLGVRNLDCLAFTLFDHDREKYAAISTLTGPHLFWIKTALLLDHHIRAFLLDHSSEQFLTTIFVLK